MAQSYRQLSKILGYHFKDENNLALALTHRSAAREHNERLEFLGDAVLGMIIANVLYQKFPKQGEGKLTRMRSSLVKGDTLAELGKEMQLGELLKLGSGELKSGGHNRSSIIADAVEAIIGAIYLESGLEVCESLVLKWFGSRIEKLDPDFHPKDSKTQLQEYLQGRKRPLPEYEVLDIKGKAHDQTFSVSCSVEGLQSKVEARGKSRRIAEQSAAKKALELLTDG